MSDQLREATEQLAAGQLETARRMCEQALLQNPDHPGWLHLAGAVDFREDRVDAAFGRFKRALEIGGPNAELLSNLGVACRTVGQFDAANAYFLQAIELDPGFARAYFDYTQTARFENDELLVGIQTRLRENEQSDDERSLLHFAAAKICSDLRRFDEAFVHYQLGNAARGARFDPHQHSRWIDRIIQAFPAERSEGPPIAAEASDRPIFVVGMPRSGTTLLEQVLAAHPQVFAAGELLDIPAISKVLPQHAPDGTGYPECIASVTPRAFPGFAGAYLRRLDQLDPNGHARVVDKNPANYLHLGLLSLMFPNAVVFHCRRDPVDTCLSCYFQKFASGHEYTFDLTHLGFYYRQHERLMQHWSRVLPAPPVEVVYEELVQAPESEIRRVLEHCGLDFQTQCLRPHEVDRAVRTASAWQVRNPISTAGLGRYEPYQAWLGPLRLSLDYFGDEPNAAPPKASRMR